MAWLRRQWARLKRWATTYPITNIKIDEERYRRDPTYHRLVEELIKTERARGIPGYEDKGIPYAGDYMTTWKTTKKTTVNMALGNAAHAAVEASLRTETQSVPFHVPGFGSGWIHIDQIKFMKGKRHGRYVVTQPGPLRQKWYASRVGPDVVSIATNHKGTWFEYAKHGPSGVVTQMKPEMQGMGNSNDVHRMDTATQLLEWLRGFITQVDTVMDAMEMAEQNLDAFQITGFIEEANHG
jgi:hypothetical protein